MKSLKLNEVFEKLERYEYVSSEVLEKYRNSLRKLFQNKFCSEEVLISYVNLTNSGGYPIVFSHSCSPYEIYGEVYGDDYTISEVEEFEELFFSNSFEL